MNKAELAEVLAAKLSMTKKQTEDMLDAFVEVVIGELKQGHEVTLTGFGEFSAKKRAARMGVDPRNPTTKIQIPEVTIPKFKAGKTLKDALKEGQTASDNNPQTPS